MRGHLGFPLARTGTLLSPPSPLPASCPALVVLTSVFFPSDHARPLPPHGDRPPGAVTLPECRLLLPFALLLHVRESRPSPPVPPSEELCGRTTLPAAVRSDTRKLSEMPRPTATDLAQLSTAQRIACTLLNPPKPLPTGPQCLAKPHSRRLAHHSPSVTPLRRNRAHRSRDVRNRQERSNQQRPTRDGPAGGRLWESQPDDPKDLESTAEPQNSGGRGAAVAAL